MPEAARVAIPPSPRCVRPTIPRQVAQTAIHATRQLCGALKRLILPVKQRLESARRLDDAALDRLAAVTLVLHSLEGAPSRQRRLLLQVLTPLSSPPVSRPCG